jgi:virulence-associated protein VapD
MSAYETVLDAAVNAVESTVINCVSFNANSVHVDYFRVEDYGAYDPICVISLQRDSVESIGPMETQHVLTFQLHVKHTGSGVRDDLNKIVSYIGEIMDKIESDRTLGTSYIENTEITGVEYSMENQQSAVINHAVMTVEVLALRNV